MTARDVRVLTVPFDTGVRDARMGLGPARLLEAGLLARLERGGHRTTVAAMNGAAEALVPEPQFAAALWRDLAQAVSAACREGAFPLVLSGVCYAAVGTVAGLGTRDLAVVWFDAHGDVNTPETTTTGFLDGMAITLMAGRCWRNLTAGVPGFTPVPEDRIALIGARDLDAPERAFLESSPIRHLAPRQVRHRLTGVLDDLGAQSTGVYLHVDLDVLDPAEARVNHLPAPGGLRIEELQSACRMIARRLPVRALALTAYDPAGDPGGVVCDAAFDVVAAVLGA
jgi:arginase